MGGAAPVGARGFGRAVSVAGGDLDVLDGIPPARAIAGDTLTLIGAHFGDAAGPVFVDGADATVLGWADDEITVEVPYSLPGTRTVSLTTAAGLDASGVSFQLVMPRRAYVAEGVTTADTHNRVAVFDVSATDALTEIAGAPFELDHNAGDQAMGMAFTSDGSRAFLTLWAGADVDTFDADPSGALTWTGEVPTVAEEGPIAASADGAWLFVLRQARHALEVFGVAADGGLTSTGASLVMSADDAPHGVVLTGF